MCRDLVKQSLKEMTRYRIRSFLVLLSVFIASIVISFLLYCTNYITDALTDMVETQSPEVNQLMVKGNDQRIPFNAIDELIETTGAVQARVNLKLPVVNSELSIKGTTYNSYSIFIYSGKYSLFTDREKASAVDTFDKGGDYPGVFITEQFLFENNIDVIDALDSNISFVLLDQTGTTYNVSTHVTGVITKSLHANMNLAEHCDIYIDGNLLTKDDSIQMDVVSVLFEYSSHYDVQKAVSIFETQNYNITIYDDKILDVQADSLIYNIICWLMECLVLITIAVSVFITFNVSFEEHKTYYGIGLVWT